MLGGRLGLETARIPHGDRQGLLWLSRGNLTVVDGTLHFIAAGSPELTAWDYAIPFQTVTMILMFRLMARHGTGLIAVGEDGVRMYTAPPLGTDDSTLARRQARLWADRESRIRVAKEMYALRFGELLSPRDLDALRGIEGARMKESYELLARKFGIEWKGRRYDRQNPGTADAPNQAINHAATAVESAASIAVAATGALPQLGFIHEESANAFTLDIADLYRSEVTVPAAFEAVRLLEKEPQLGLERLVRRHVGRRMRERGLIPGMIDRIKGLLDADDGGGHA
jgi:CRISP-associated protein Cas1